MVMSDIIERLLAESISAAAYGFDKLADTTDEAADEITALRAENKRLRADNERWADSAVRLLDENARLLAIMAKAHATMIATGWREASFHGGFDIVALAATEIEGEFAAELAKGDG